MDTEPGKKPEGVIERVVEAPAIALEEGVEATEAMERKIINKRPFRLAEEYWNTLGPGLTTGAADDDPSGIATYSQTGAQYGFQLLWLALFSFPLMAVVQEMCARIGLVTGRGLAANIKAHYAPWILYSCATLLFAANTFNLGADLGAMAKAVQLLAPTTSFALLVIGFAVLSLLLQIFSTYARYAKYLKYLALILFSYVLSALVIHLDWHTIVLRTLIPSLTFSRDQIFLVCAILGTTISPYLFFWQTSQEVEEEILKGKTTVELRKEDTSPKEIKDMRTDIWSGMFISNLVMFFIIITCAATLFSHGITNITTADQAAQALRPLAGNLAFLLFTLGIVGTGLLAVPVMAGSASYALSESFGWEQGLYKKLKQAYPFYGVIIISMLLGLAMNFLHIDPIKALIYSAVANGLIAPIVLVLIVKISSSKHIMGEYTNNAVTTWIGWITTILMIISGVAVIVSLFWYS
jgi:NRAMP (natural resistance-associated macrophage protein)-like metal ion transporter